MERILKQLSDQMKKMQDQITALQQESSKVDEPRLANNSAIILTTETNFDVWHRMITGELSSLKYDDMLLEPKPEDGVENFNPEDPSTKGRLNFVTTFLLTRVDDSYRTSICDIGLPHEMLKKIHDMRFPNLLSMRMTLERQWSNIVMSDRRFKIHKPARVEKTSSATANLAEKEEKSNNKNVICFRCDRPNHIASACTNSRKICYNCEKFGQHEQKDCTAPKTYYPIHAKFPAGRIEKSFRGQSFQGSFRGRGRSSRRTFRGRGRSFSGRGYYYYY
ncbi:hypothetical protein PGB90_009010 [Kerria lacca]